MFKDSTIIYYLKILKNDLEKNKYNDDDIYFLMNKLFFLSHKKINGVLDWCINDLFNVFWYRNRKNKNDYYFKESELIEPTRLLIHDVYSIVVHALGEYDFKKRLLEYERTKNI